MHLLLFYGLIGREVILSKNAIESTGLYGVPNASAHFSNQVIKKYGVSGTVISGMNATILCEEIEEGIRSGVLFENLVYQGPNLTEINKSSKYQLFYTQDKDTEQINSVSLIEVYE